MHSTFTVEKATQGCLLLCQDIRLDLSKWQVLLVLFLSNLHPVKSGSKNLTRLSATPFGYYKPTLTILLRYFKILFATL